MDKGDQGDNPDKVQAAIEETKSRAYRNQLIGKIKESVGEGDILEIITMGCEMIGLLSMHALTSEMRRQRDVEEKQSADIEQLNRRVRDLTKMLDARDLATNTRIDKAGKSHIAMKHKVAQLVTHTGLEEVSTASPAVEESKEEVPVEKVPDQPTSEPEESQETEVRF